MYEGQEYRASKSWPYAISAGCVVYRQKNDEIEVLLLKRQSGHSYNHVPGDSYNLPKGHIDFGETPTQTAERETVEEAGCRVEIKTYLGSVERDFIHPFHKNRNIKTILFFAAKWVEDVDEIDQEHDVKVWVSVKEAMKLLAKPNPKGEDEIVKRLQKFLELTNG